MLIAAPTWWLLTRTALSDGAAVANVLALPFGVIGVVAALYGLRSSSSANDATLLLRQARTLTAAVATAEARTLMQLLGDTGEPRPADVAYARLEASLVSWRSDGGDQAGSLLMMADYYRSLQRGRLVVLGEGGAGKTVAVLRLLLDLAAGALGGPADAPAEVPVRLSLPSFRTSRTIAAEIRVELDKWIIEHLVSVHNVSPALASALVAEGWILPILDGLDEMDPDSAAPVRAQQVINALNLPVGPGLPPVVVSCRTARYQLLGDDDSGEPLQDATAILLQPLDADQVSSWIHHRLPHPDQRARWRAVLATLRAHPNGRLGRCLSSPLRLYLALTVYAKSDTRPKTLCDLGADELDPHLFARLIPALTANHPRENGDHYEPVAVERWLRTLARHLARADRTGGSATEFTLEELWRSDGEPPGKTIRNRTVLLLVLAASVLWSVDYSFVIGADAPSWAIAASLLCGVGLLLYNIRLVWSSELQKPVRVDLRQVASPRTINRLKAGAGEGLKVGPVLGVVVVGVAAVIGFLLGPEDGSEQPGLLATIVGTVVFGLWTGFVAGPIVGMLAAFVESFQAIHDSATTPSEPYRQAKRAIQLISIPGGIVLGIVQSFTDGLASGVAMGLVFGSMLGFTLSGAGRWYLQHRVYARRAARAGDLPDDLPEFLDWAYRAGLLRLSGSSTQFRHREVQLYFTGPGTA